MGKHINGHNRALTKQQLIELGVTDVTKDGKVFKDGVECKIKILENKYKHSTNVYQIPAISFVDKSKKIPFVTKDGYNSYTYGALNISVARIMFVWFIRDLEYGEQIDHIDNNPMNNTLDNLQALTQAENLKKKGISRNQFTWNLTDEEILKRRAEKEAEKEKEQNRIKEKKRRIRCRKHAYEICRYYKHNKNRREWITWMTIKNKPELSMDDCYAIELTYSLLEKEIKGNEKNK